MKKSIKPALLVLVIVTLVTQACNILSPARPTPFAFPTPDMTLTSVFSSLASPTPPLVQTATTAPGLPTQAPTQQGTPPLMQTFVPATLLPTSTTGAVFNTNTPPAPTAAPLATSTPHVSRSGAALKATFMSSAPTIDANLGEWRSTSFPVNSVVYGANLWDNRQDLTGEVWLGWDNNNLYIAARVTDEDYVQLATEDNIYQGDSVEILLDANLTGDANDRSLSSDDYQIGISPGNPDPGEDAEGYRWFPREREDTLTEVRIDAARTDTGYIVEIALPWTYLGVTPAQGARYGFAISISDNDKTGFIVQQTMISTASNRHLTDPTTWGTLELLRP